jgi:hypothetical protein
MVSSLRVSIPASVHPRGGWGWAALCAGTFAASAVLSLVGWNAVRLASGQVSLSDLACVGDPTDPCNWSSYRVQNDTDAPVVLRECMQSCARGDRRLDPVSVKTGEVTSGHAVTALVGGRAWWEVRSSSNHLLGCLVLDGHRHKQDGDLVRVSFVQPCRANAPMTPTRAPVLQQRAMPGRI